MHNEKSMLSTQYDEQTDDSLSSLIIRSIAIVKNVDPLDLDPIHRTLDGEALETLVKSGDASLRVSFPYEAHTVTVNGNGSVMVETGT